jgi:hypothetical protein
MFTRLCSYGNSCEEVHSFALDQGHTVFANDIEYFLLGHRFTDDVIRHTYYRTKRIIGNLRRFHIKQTNSEIITMTEEVSIPNK